MQASETYLWYQAINGHLRNSRVALGALLSEDVPRLREWLRLVRPSDPYLKIEKESRESDQRFLSRHKMHCQRVLVRELNIAATLAYQQKILPRGKWTGQIEDCELPYISVHSNPNEGYPLDQSIAPGKHKSIHYKIALPTMIAPADHKRKAGAAVLEAAGKIIEVLEENGAFVSELKWHEGKRLHRSHPLQVKAIVAQCGEFKKVCQEWFEARAFTPPQARLLIEGFEAFKPPLIEKIRRAKPLSLPEVPPPTEKKNPTQPRSRRSFVYQRREEAGQESLFAVDEPRRDRSYIK